MVERRPAAAPNWTPPAGRLLAEVGALYDASARAARAAAAAVPGLLLAGRGRPLPARPRRGRARRRRDPRSDPLDSPQTPRTRAEQSALWSPRRSRDPTVATAGPTQHRVRRARHRTSGVTVTDSAKPDPAASSLPHGPARPIYADRRRSTTSSSCAGATGASPSRRRSPSWSGTSPTSSATTGPATSWTRRSIGNINVAAGLRSAAVRLDLRHRLPLLPARRTRRSTRWPTKLREEFEKRDRPMSALLLIPLATAATGA